MKRSTVLSLLIVLALVAAAAVLSRPASSERSSGGPALLNPGAPLALQATLPTTAIPTSLPATDVPNRQYAAVLQLDPSATPYAIAAEALPQAPAVTEIVPSQEPEMMQWSPPPLPVPLARHPLDHYWMQRPLTSNYVNTGLLRYPYGSDGVDNDLKVHHGIDLSNPNGTEVHAVADGVVSWAGSGHHSEWETVAAYGNTVSIEHDFAYQGQRIYTLYAHLSAILVGPGERVEAGEVIGLIGATGQATGPHVHFEVRLGQNDRPNTLNPDLWIAPYTGTGVIAGHLAYPGSQTAMDVEVQITDLSTGEVTHRVTTYASPDVRSDPGWGENFVVPNVPVGSYLLTAAYGAVRWSAEMNVLEGMTNWADMQIHGSAESPASSTPLP